MVAQKEGNKYPPVLTFPSMGGRKINLILAFVIDIRQEYKDWTAAMSPKPNKPIWQLKRKHKKMKRSDDWHPNRRESRHPHEIEVTCVCQSKMASKSLKRSGFGSISVDIRKPAVLKKDMNSMRSPMSNATIPVAQC
ncbi:hypothetical protein AWC38_SpisGene15548 [Stylophora pistillata]|uniref:Uncharacterized protein n=1 Tax=Stylophora pistillata TaxID=50429 RepID=A0A2B4RUX7_STYPI|nr:hypothetical protein AWC38_SpisGene15548 [Stylophora pistillata]